MGVDNLLDFFSYLSLLIIAFAFSMIVVRCLIAVVNRGFLLVDYAQEKLYPEGKKPGGKFGIMDMVGFGFEVAKPAIKNAIQGAMGTKPK